MNALRSILAALAMAAVLAGCGPRGDAVNDGRTEVRWMVPVRWDRPIIEAFVRRFEADASRHPRQD
jgi:ABC-type glycerol-3-phosphate transport system substrate-binding protein